MDLADIELARKYATPDMDLESTALRICAIREVLEETGILLGDNPKVLGKNERVLLGSYDLSTGISSLQKLATWITPRELASNPKGGYETNFFVSILSGSPVLDDAAADGEETSDLQWLTPVEALNISLRPRLPIPQLYMTTELNTCRNHDQLPAFVKLLNRGIFRYPFRPRYAVIPNRGFMYVLPGDHAHDEYRPITRQRWEHRGIYDSIGKDTPVWSLVRSHALRIEAGAAAIEDRDWCEQGEKLPGSKI